MGKYEARRIPDDVAVEEKVGVEGAREDLPLFCGITPERALELFETVEHDLRRTIPGIRVEDGVEVRRLWPLHPPRLRLVHGRNREEYELFSQGVQGAGEVPEPHAEVGTERDPKVRQCLLPAFVQRTGNTGF